MTPLGDLLDKNRRFEELAFDVVDVDETVVFSEFALEEVVDAIDDFGEASFFLFSGLRRRRLR